MSNYLSSPAKRVRQTTKFFGCLHHGRGPSGAQGTPWEGTLGSPRDPMGGDPWEPKGTHGRGPLGAEGIPWERTLGTSRDPMGGDPWGLNPRVAQSIIYFPLADYSCFKQTIDFPEMAQAKFCSEKMKIFIAGVCFIYF